MSGPTLADLLADVKTARAAYVRARAVQEAAWHAKDIADDAEADARLRLSVATTLLCDALPEVKT